MSDFISLWGCFCNDKVREGDLVKFDEIDVDKMRVHVKKTTSKKRAMGVALKSGKVNDVILVAVEL